MGTYPVSPAKENLLSERMAALGVREEDIEESFVRSGGRGGQNVNKTSTCVQLKHIPTGLEVKCQKERSQALNRYHARVLLLRKLEHLIKGRESEEAARIEKLRRQKRKRSRRAREKIREEKERVSEKKASRAFRTDLDD
ncbi:MAG: peptide chain release factor family protein [Chloroflexota bacterium]